VADTGLPWSLPYPLSSDLVRDGASDIEALADAVADGLTAAVLPGIGSNVVQTVKTDTFTTSGNTFIDITGLEATITPTSTASKILIVCNVTHGPQGRGTYLQVLRGATVLDIRGDAAGNRVRTAGASMASGLFNPSEAQFSNSIVFLDSPATDLAVTYKIQVRSGTGGSSNSHINRSHSDTDNDNFGRGASSITLIEVAA
jgi:hypothetical protein